MLYPSAANKTVLGERKEFSVKHFHDFQTVLSTFGDENVSYAKKKFVDLVLDDGYDPASFTMPKLAVSSNLLLVYAIFLLFSPNRTARTCEWLCVK
jgi:hypothetical protein